VTALAWAFRVASSSYGLYKLKGVAEDPFKFDAPLEFLEGYAFLVAPWAALRNPSIQAVKWGGLTLVKKGWGITNFIRFGSGTVSIGAGELVASVLAGYIVGATVGTGIAYVGWGKEGAEAALSLYTGQVSFDEYTEVVFNDPSGKKFAWFDSNIGKPIRHSINSASFDLFNLPA